MLFKYIALLYAKHLFFILLALVGFFVFFDFILTLSRLPEATNIQLLYASFKAMEALDTLWQISAVFAFITAWISLVRSNAIVSIYALGYDKKMLMLPFISIFGLLYIAMNIVGMTEFSHAKDKASQIRSHGAVGSVTRDIFFKYDESYVYMNRLFPLQKKAENLRIFEFDSEQNIKVINAPKAYFESSEWVMPEVEITTILDTKVITYGETGYTSLRHFKPRVLESVYESGSGFTLIDAFNALTLLVSQGVKTDSIRAILYHKLITPFFALLIILIFFFKLPIHARFSNLTITTTLFTTISLLVWGVLFATYRVTVTGVVSPEIGMILPILLLFFYLLYLFKKAKI